MHGLFNVPGLIGVAIIVLQEEPVNWLLLGGFALVALGGAFLLWRHRTGKG